MVDFVAYPSRWRIALLILLAATFVTLGLWMVGVFGAPPNSRRYPAAVIFVVGWFSVFFFGLCGIVGVKKLFDTSEQLRIGPTGVRWTPWSDLTVPWSEVTDVTTWNYKRNKTIVLHLRNPKQFPCKRSLGIFAGANRMLTGGDVSISLTATDRTFSEAMSAIERFRT